MRQLCPDYQGALSLWCALNRACFEARGQELGRVQIELKHLATKAGCRYRKAIGLMADLVAAGLVEKPAGTPHAAIAYQLRGCRYPADNPCTKRHTSLCTKRHTTLCAGRPPSRADRKRNNLEKKGAAALRTSRTPSSQEARGEKITARDASREPVAANADAAAPVPPHPVGDGEPDTAETVKPSLPPERYRECLARVAKLRESLPSTHDGPGWTERYQRSQAMKAEISRLEAEAVRLEAQSRAYLAAQAKAGT